jgi:hypothetical protein
MANISINELSLTISELVDLDPNQQSLIESAITRAISAKESKDVVGGNKILDTIIYFGGYILGRDYN